jgi:D-3-phosphoglycerate dehydrogenase
LTDARPWHVAHSEKAIPMKIVRTDMELQMPHVDKTLRDMGHDIVLLPDGVTQADLIQATRDADLILMCYTPITREVIEASPQLAGIVKYGVGIDAIDIPAAIERGIPVVNIPEYSEETVAEGAFTMLLALAKKLTELDRHMRQTGWTWPEAKWLCSDIAGKTVGVVGLGKIGKSLARMAGAGFRARVVAYDPYVSHSEMARLGVQKFDTLHDMLAECDFISLHSVLNAETRNLLSHREFAAMKRGAILINVARGALIDEDALRQALLSGHLEAVGLDVFCSEPLNLETHPLSDLFAMENVILSPHLTFFSKEAMDRLQSETLARCQEIIDGRPVTVHSHDPRLRAQSTQVSFPDQTTDPTSRGQSHGRA